MTKRFHSWLLMAMSLVLLSSASLSAAAQNVWQRLPLPPGVTTAEVRDIRFSPAGVLFVSYYAQGTWCSPDSGQTWQNISYNLPALPAGGFFCFNAQGDVLLGPDDSSNFAIYRLPLNGTAWVASSIDVGQSNASEFTGKMVLTDTGKIVCNTSRSRVLRSTDGGSSFQFIGVSAAYLGAAMFSLNKSPVTNDLYIGTETGPEFVSSDEGTTWTSIGAPGGNVRIGFNRFGTPFGETTHSANPIPRVLARYTGGTTWVASDTGLPDYADSRTFGLASSGQMYVGSYDVYTSLDDGSTWSLAGSGFPTNSPLVQVQCMTIAPDDSVYVGLAHGSATNFGVWMLPSLSQPPLLTSIAVTPATATVTGGSSQQFSAVAKNQYGAAMTPQPSISWSVSSGGSVNANGLFTASSSAGGPFTITVTSGTVSGTAQVSVTNGTSTGGSTTGGTTTSGSASGGTTTGGSTSGGTTTGGTTTSGSTSGGTTTGGHSGADDGGSHRCGLGFGLGMLALLLSQVFTRMSPRGYRARYGMPTRTRD